MRKSLAVKISRQFIYQEESIFFFRQKTWCFSMLNSIQLKEMGKLVDLILFTSYSSFLEGQVPLNEGKSFWFPCLVSLSAVLPVGQGQQSLQQNSPLAY